MAALRCVYCQAKLKRNRVDGATVAVCDACLEARVLNPKK